ncbi:MAG TPA: type IX secretion system outer membrane channel protein PorV [Chryseolinea sp.]|nr:type IX secretion system outer membrane channel protein PorV [Chryseolinea sp.]
MKNTLMKFRILAIVSALGITQFSVGQINNAGQDQNAITTAVPFLLISPDSRSAGLGEAGVATSPDANSSYWNAGKLVFIEKEYGGSLSYTPWLGKLVNDMSISYLTGFYKINRESVISSSLKYFDLGEITFNSGPNPVDILGVYNPRELAFDVTYSRKLTENFSLGITGRYINSNLVGSISGTDAQAANSVAADIGAFYTKDYKGAKPSNLSLGASITNIGGKMTYTDDNNKDFIPTNLRFGSAYKREIDAYNSLTFTIDFNKLMVPTPNADSSDQNKELLGGMFGSFSDAPGGAKEEFQEITTSIGLEYWYNDIFAARLGYFNESKYKGNRKYFTVGLGFRKKAFGFDVAYLVPTNKRESPLAETIRFTLLLQFDKIRAEEEESVTD